MGFSSSSDIYDDLYDRGKLSYGSLSTPKETKQDKINKICEQLYAMHMENPRRNILAFVRQNKPEHYKTVRDYFYEAEIEEYEDR